MSLPQLSTKQRSQNLAKARAARTQRSDIKAQVRAHTLTVEEVLEMSATDEVLAKMRVRELLQAVPSFGPRKVERLMAEAKIAPSRRLRGLGHRQRAAVLAATS